MIKFIFWHPCGEVIKKFYVSNRENYGRQKINLIVHVKINEKSWISKTVYVKHLLFFLNFWVWSTCNFFRLKWLALAYGLNSCRLFNTTVHTYMLFTYYPHLCFAKAYFEHDYANFCTYTLPHTRSPFNQI